MAEADRPHRAVVAGWAAAEESLYGPLLSDPAAYERVVTLVGVLVDHLRRTVHDVGGLVEAAGRGTGLVAEVSPELAVPWVPLEAALRAACAMRYRELLAAQQREDRRMRLAGAAEAGADWARIVDIGSVAAPPVAPALVVHLRSGMGIRCTTEMDPETGGARFVSSPVVVDLPTGEVTGPLPAAGPVRDAATLAQRDADLRRLQEAIERLDSQGRVG